MAIRIDTTSGKFLSRTTFGSNSASWTMAGWVYAVTSPANGSYYGVIYKTKTGSQDACEFLNSGGNLKLTLWDGTTETTSATISTTTWYHVAVVRESSSVLKLYINGVLDHTGGTGSTAAQDGVTRIGCWDSTTDIANARFAGWKIWSTGLTAAEVAQEFYTLSPRRYANLIGFLPMFPGSGERVRDYSGLGNSYTENGTLTDEDPPPVTWGSRSGRRLIVTGGATQYNQSIDVSVTNSFSLIKAAGKVIAITNTPSVSNQSITNKNITATAANTVDQSKQTNTTLVISANSTVDQTKRSDKGIITTVTTLVEQLKQSNKIIDSAATSSVTQTKQTDKALSFTQGVSVTIVAALSYLLSISVNVANSVGLNKLIDKFITLATSSTITKSVGVDKSISTESATNANINKSIDKFLVFSQAVTVSLESLKVILKDISVTVNSTISLSRSTIKDISIAVNNAVSAGRQINKNISIIILPILTPVKDILVSMNFTANNIVSLTKSVIITIATSIENSVSFATQYIQGGATPLVAFYKNTRSIALRAANAATVALSTLSRTISLKDSDDAEL